MNGRSLAFWPRLELRSPKFCLSYAVPFEFENSTDPGLQAIPVRLRDTPPLHTCVAISRPFCSVAPFSAVKFAGNGREFFKAVCHELHGEWKRVSGPEPLPAKRANHGDG